MMIPTDNEEVLVIRCFMLSIESGFSSVNVNYQVVRDFSKKYKLDSIELYQVIKSMAGELNSG